MKSLNTKLALSALAVALLATPALAKSHQHISREQIQDYAGSASVQPLPEHYPNGAARTGTADSVQSGAEFNLGS
jgi:hypothetical protein